MSRKPFTVENQRARRVVRLFGRVLAPKGRGRTSCMDLSAQELGQDACKRLLATGRLKLIRGDMDELQADVEMLPPPLLMEELLSIMEVDSEIEEVEQPVEPALEVELNDTLVAPTYTRDALMEMTGAELKELCREAGLKISGSKSSLVGRILASQAVEE